MKAIILMLAVALSVAACATQPSSCGDRSPNCNSYNGDYSGGAGSDFE